jgi:hypothetical protein
MASVVHRERDLTRNLLLSFALIAGLFLPTCAIHASHRHLQGRYSLHRHEAVRRLSGSRWCAVMGCDLDGNQPCRHTSLAYSLDEPAHRSQPRWRRR